MFSIVPPAVIGHFSVSSHFFLKYDTTLLQLNCLLICASDLQRKLFFLGVEIYAQFKRIPYSYYQKISFKLYVISKASCKKTMYSGDFALPFYKQGCHLFFFIIIIIYILL
ncbi:hypothetical protein BD770DRAFT_414945 [Pilaira anomala]|nr:hypothetical protein BD770DRAFT_414945 [Pilaira anomala]